MPVVFRYIHVTRVLKSLSFTFSALFNALFHFLDLINLIVSLALAKSFEFKIVDFLASFDAVLYVVGFFWGSRKDISTFSIFFSGVTFFSFFCFSLTILSEAFVCKIGFFWGKLFIVSVLIFFSIFLKIDGFFSGKMNSFSE